MTQRFALRRIGAALTIASFVLVSGCKGGGTVRRPINTPGATPSATAPGVSTNSVQGLYESGRYQEVVNGVGAGDRSAQLPEAGGSAAWQAVSDLALALLRDDAGEIDRGRQTAAAFPGDPFVQYELGLAHARRGDMAAAAEAFDRVTQADPRFAYGYYNGGLAYDRLNRTDLAITRLEMFVRLAPDAPERPEVASILQTVRAR